MGQQIGKGHVLPAAEAFVNLPQSAIDGLWRAFNLNTDGWGLNPQQFVDLCSVLRGSIGVASDADLDAALRALFDVFDTDKNDRVDALELVATIAAISGVEMGAKMRFIFSLYDFSEKEELVLDEVTLLLKSTVTGLSKLSGKAPPDFGEFEALARLCVAGGRAVRKADFLAYGASNPVVSSWLAHYEDMDAADGLLGEAASVFKKKKKRALAPRSADHLKAKRGAPPSEWATKDAAHGPDLLAFHKELAPKPAGGGKESTPPESFLTKKPDSSFVREWVYGYGAPTHTGGNGNLFYTVAGKVAYAAAELGVLYSFPDGGGGEEAATRATQKFMVAHKEAVLCVALSCDGRTLCSGDRGGRVCLWDGGTAALVAILQARGSAPVTHVDISKDGAFVAAVDAGPKLTVFHTTTGTLAFASSMVSKDLFGFAFAARGSCTMATAGPTTLQFWVQQQGAAVDSAKNKKQACCWAPKNAVDHSKAKSAHTAIVGLAADDVFASGTAQGALVLWQGRNLKAVLADAHRGAVSGLHVSGASTLTSCGAEDSKVKVWRLSQEEPALLTLDLIVQVDALAFGASGPLVACCLHPGGSKILVGTAAQEIFEVLAKADETSEEEQQGDPRPVGTATGGGPLVRGPVSFVVATSPEDDDDAPLVAIATSATMVAAVGGDAVTVFDLEQRRALHREKLNARPSAVAFSVDGAQLAVGTVAGTVDVFDCTVEALTLASTCQVCAVGEAPMISNMMRISGLRFAEDGMILGVSAGATLIFFERGASAPVAEEDNGEDAVGYPVWVKKTSIELPSAVTSFDLSTATPAVAQVGTHGQDLKFFKTEDGSAVAPKEAKAKTWLSQTTPTARAFGGVPGSIACVSPQDLKTLGASAKFAVAADPFGAVHVFNSPAAAAAAAVGGGKAAYATLKGHSSAVVGVAFLGATLDDDAAAAPTGLLTAGAEDGCLTEWKIDLDEVQDEAEGEATAANDDDDQEDDEEKTTWLAATDSNLTQGAALIDASKGALYRAVRDDEQLEEDPAAAAASTTFAVGWTAAAPTDEAPRLKETVPCDDLSLEWVHGYSAQAQRNNVRYNSLGEVVYPAASVGVVLDKNARRQRHCLAHSGEVTCLTTLGDLTATAFRCASDEAAPTVALWYSTDNLEASSSSSSSSSSFHVACSPFKIFSAAKGGRAVSAMALTRCGAFLAVAACDDAHTLTLFDVASGSEVASAPMGADNKALAMSFSAAKELLVGAVDAFSVWDCGTNLGEITGKRGIFGAAAPRQSIFSVAWLDGAAAAEDDDDDDHHLEAAANEVAVVGGALGGVFKVEGRMMTDGGKQHVGPVYAMASVKRQPLPPGKDPEENPVWSVALVTGGFDGKIKLLGDDLEVKLEFDMAKPVYDSVCFAIASVCLNHDRRKVLVGTLGSEIYEISTQDEADVNGGPVVTGHCTGALKGLAPHPILKQVATVGDDATLRLWDVSTYESPASRGHRELRRLRLDDMARCVAFSPNGHLVAVGLGASEFEGLKSGTILVVTTLKPDLEVVRELKKSASAITAVKFSPDGELLVCAANDGAVYVYDTLNEFVVKAEFSNSSSEPLTGLEFSRDSRFVRGVTSNNQATVTLEATTGEPIESSDPTLRDEEWESWTLPVGYGVEGAYDGAFAAASDLASVHRSSDLELLASGDDAGRVRLQRWPCVDADAPAKSFQAHSDRVASVRFTPTADHLASCGERDRCLVQWKRLRNNDHHKASEALSPKDEATAAALGARFAPGGPKSKEEEEEPPLVDWKAKFPKGGAAAGTLTAAEVGALPSKVAFAYGVPQWRNSIGYTAAGDVVYGLGRLGVVYSKEKHAQKFFDGAEARMTALAVSPDGAFACSAEATGSLTLWEAATCCTLQVLPRHLAGRVTHLAFSPTGASSSYVAAVGCGGPRFGNAAVLTVYASSSGTFKGDARHVSTTPLTFAVVSFLSCGSSRVASFDVALGGLGKSAATPDVVFYAIQGRNLVAMKTVYGSAPTLGSGFTCGAVVEGACFTGDAAGRLSVWTAAPDSMLISSSCVEVVCAAMDDKAHPNGCEAAVGCAASASCVTAGTEDGWVKVWSPGLTVTAAFKLDGVKCPIFALAVDAQLRRVAALTADGRLFETVCDSGATACLLKGEAVDAVAAFGHLVATASQTGLVAVYDTKRRTKVADWHLAAPLSALAWSNDGSRLVVGFGSTTMTTEETPSNADGKFAVLAFDAAGGAPLLGEPSFTGHNAKKAVTVLKFSPDSLTLALASADGAVYLYTASNNNKEDDATTSGGDDNYGLYAAFDKHAAPVEALDFCAHSKFLRSSAADATVLACDVASGELADASNVTAWASDTCKYTWATQGAQPALAHQSLLTSPVSENDDGSNNNSSNNNNNEDRRTATPAVLAVLTAAGRLRFYASPAVDKAPVFDVQAHAAKPGGLALATLGEQTVLFTAAPTESALLQWGPP